MAVQHNEGKGAVLELNPGTGDVVSNIGATAVDTLGWDQIVGTLSGILLNEITHLGNIYKNIFIVMVNNVLFLDILCFILLASFALKYMGFDLLHLFF